MVDRCHARRRGAMTTDVDVLHRGHSGIDWCGSGGLQYADVPTGRGVQRLMLRRLPSSAGAARSPGPRGDPIGPVLPPGALLLLGAARASVGIAAGLGAGEEVRLRVAGRVDQAGDVARRC